MLKLETAQAGPTRCPHCGRVMAFQEHDEPGQTVEVLSQEDDLADEFLTKARLSLRKKLLVVCGACHQRLTIEQRLAGRVIRCVACGGQIRVPNMGQDEPEYAPPSTQSPRQQGPQDAAGSHVAAAEESPEATDLAAAGATDKDQPPATPAASRRGRVGKKSTFVALAVCAALLAGAAVTVLMTLEEPPPAQPVGRESPRAAAEPAAPGEGQSLPREAAPAASEGQTNPAPASPSFFGLVSPSSGGGADSRPVVPTPPRSLPTGGRVSIASADVTFLESDLPPAVGHEAYLDLAVEFLPSDGEARIAPESVLVQAGQQRCKLAALGASGTPQKLLPPSAMLVPAGQAFRQRMVFLVPEDFSAGELRVAGAGKAPVNSPRRFVPPPGVEGSFVETGRFLRVGFDQPLLERIRRSERGQLLLRRDGAGVSVNLPELGLSGQASPAPDGGWSLALGDAQGQLACRLRLVAPDRLVLYLSDRPYHQIVYERR
jgi:DNA-directed RNA polymerase subunit RPC12/RpoP